MDLLSPRFHVPVVERLPGRRIRVRREAGGTWTELRVERLDLVMLAATVGLLAWTVAGLLAPISQFAAVVPAFDLVFDTIGLLVTLAVAGFAWIRYRENGDMFNLFEASAFLVLAIPNAVHLAVMMADPDVAAGMSVVDQGQAPIYSFTIARITAAVLLALGAVVYGGGRRPRSSAVVVLAPALVVLAEVVAVHLADRVAPALAVTASPVGGSAGARPVATPLAIVLGGAAAVMFLVAAILARRSVGSPANVGRAYLTFGLLFAAFAQLDAIFDPSYAGVVSAADVLRLAFYIVLLLGLTAEATATLHNLAAANDDLARLKDVEVERSALEERARLSRELHDGLAQELWFAKLKASRLATLPSLDAEGQELVSELSGAIDLGLAESRQAVLALREGGDPRTSFHELLAHCVDDFEDRFGVPAERSFAALAPELRPRDRAELLRIAQEALSNAGHHAEATLVWVQTALSTDAFRMSIRDNGRGFDPLKTDTERFGLAGMRERAALVGGQITIESEPHRGTSVLLTLPVADAAGQAGNAAS